LVALRATQVIVPHRDSPETPVPTAEFLALTTRLAR
jgi:hypothetical protein